MESLFQNRKRREQRSTNRKEKKKKKDVPNIEHKVYEVQQNSIIKSSKHHNPIQYLAESIKILKEERKEQEHDLKAFSKGFSKAVKHISNEYYGSLEKYLDEDEPATVEDNKIDFSKVFGIHQDLQEESNEYIAIDLSTRGKCIDLIEEADIPTEKENTSFNKSDIAPMEIQSTVETDSFKQTFFNEDWSEEILIYVVNNVKMLESSNMESEVKWDDTVNLSSVHISEQFIQEGISASDIMHEEDEKFLHQ